MTHANRVYFATAIGLVAYGASWLIAGIADQPLLWYEPLTRAWLFQAHAPSPVAMDWYGRVLQGLVSSGVIGTAAWVVLGAIGKPVPKNLPWHIIVGGWAGAVMLLCMLLYAVTLAQRTVFPPAG